ncbi:putative HR-like lesion-inducer [Helianthus anomalus]
MISSCRYLEFGTDGRLVVKVLEPKLNVFTKLITFKTGIKVPEFYTKHVVVAMIVLQGFGGVAFIFGSYLGAILLAMHQLVFTHVLNDFYNYDVDETEFSQLFSKFTQVITLFASFILSKIVSFLDFKML